MIVKPDGKPYTEYGTNYPYLYDTERGAKAALKSNWDICRRDKSQVSKCKILKMTLTYEWDGDDYDE